MSAYVGRIRGQQHPRRELKLPGKRIPRVVAGDDDATDGPLGNRLPSIASRTEPREQKSQKT